MSEIPTRPRENAWRASHGLGDKFVFLYSGTLGLKHNPLLLTTLADAFADDPSVAVVVASEGAGTNLLAEALASKPRRNLHMLPLQPIEAFPDVLGSADVMVALLEADAGRFSVPSKVLSYLCAGRAVLLAAPKQNLAAQTVVDARAGLVVGAEETESFVAAARQLRADADQRAQFATSGRAYAEQHFSVPNVAKRFLEVFERARAG